MAKATQALQVAWKLAEWCPAAKISQSQVRKFPPELQPESVRIGKSRIIVESPQDWLRRVGSGQAT
jgi:hypothetical protein